MATCGQEVVCIGDVLALADLESGGYVIGDDVVSCRFFQCHALECSCFVVYYESIKREPCKTYI
jgi:hypothetical protein